MLAQVRDFDGKYRCTALTQPDPVSTFPESKVAFRPFSTDGVDAFVFAESHFRGPGEAVHRGGTGTRSSSQAWQARAIPERRSWMPLGIWQRQREVAVC